MYGFIKLIACLLDVLKLHFRKYDLEITHPEYLQKI